MKTSKSQTVDATELNRANQLSLAGLFSIITAVALVLGYAARLGQDSLMLAFIYGGWVLVFGCIIGFISRDWKNAFFWGGLYTLLAFLAVAGGRISHPAVGVGWGAVGAFVGSCAGTQLPKNFAVAILASSVLGLLTMSGILLSMGQELTRNVGFDTLCAGVVGGLLKPFTTVLQWFERESRQPRFVLASWLAISVLIGNYLVPIIAGVQR